MSAKKRADPNFKYWYAAQVFGEMLGQVCFHDFFMNPHMAYQEVPSPPIPFPSHFPHTLPHILPCISKSDPTGFYYSHCAYYGLHLLLQIPQTVFSRNYEIRRQILRHAPRGSGVVKLRRTKPFHMRKTSERIDLFHLIAQLWRYLVSGNSHVGYLYNYPENPIHKIVPPSLPSRFSM